MAKITELRYYSENGNIVELRVVGHFTEAADLAHRIAGILLGPNGRWRFTKIDGIMPQDSSYASETILYITARNIPVNNDRSYSH